VIFEVEGKKVARFPSGFGEYTMGHEANAYKIPDNVSYLQAAVTTDMAYVLGVIKRSGAMIGDSAVIIGAGPIGLRTLEAAKLSGIAPLIVSEPVDFRLECAGDLGADVLIDPISEDAVDKVMEVTDGKGVDFVFDTAGNANATAQGLEMLRTSQGGEGRVLLMGLYENPFLTINTSLLMRKAGKIIGEWGIRTTRRKNIIDTLSLMAKGKLNIERWITHQIPEAKAEDAMRMLIEKKDNAIGVEIIH
jgi:threonine dehydrogenase-like Zn-dependent dehydrogenase